MSEYVRFPRAGEIQYWIGLKGGPLQPLNVPGPRAHLVIKRTRKWQIARARHMMAEHNHTSYEWSQWWHAPARKPKRWKQ